MLKFSLKFYQDFSANDEDKKCKNELDCESPEQRLYVLKAYLSVDLNLIQKVDRDPYLVLGFLNDISIVMCI
jgi:hypothetical protein